MKFKLFELLNIIEPLGRFLQKELPIKTAYNLSKAAKAIENELKTFEESRVKLVEKYGEPSESGEYEVKKGTAGYENFTRDITELTDVEVDIPLTPINISSLIINISPAEISALEKLFTD